MRYPHLYRQPQLVGPAPIRFGAALSLAALGGALRCVRPGPRPLPADFVRGDRDAATRPELKMGERERKSSGKRDRIEAANKRADFQDFHAFCSGLLRKLQVSNRAASPRKRSKNSSANISVLLDI